MGRRNGRIMVVIAIFELVLAGAFWFVFTDGSEDDVGMQITALILGSVGAVMLVIGLLWLRGAASKDRISTTGVAGTGQVMELRQTGLMVNDQPQVELDLLVTIPGRSPYRTRVKEIVPLIMLPDARGTLPVRVDPAKPKSVVIQWDQVGLGSFLPGMPPGVVPGMPPGGMPGASSASGIREPWMAAGSPQMWAPGGFGGPPGAPGSSSDETLAEVAAGLAAGGAGGAAPVYGDPSQAGYTVDQLRADLRANGLAGTARIDRLEDSGRTIGDERLFTMTVTVSIPGRPSFVSGPSAAMVPLEKVGRIAVGVALPVRVGADNQDLMMFEWDRI